jgi:hypothetical protein
LNLGTLNNSVNATTYYDDISITRRLGEETRERQRGSREIAKTVSRGGVGAGPPSATPNQRRRTVHRHPVTADAQQGQRYADVMEVGGSPVAYVEGEFDGRGGSYKERLQAPLGRFSRVNALLSYESDTESDLTRWDADEDNSGDADALLSSTRPRELRIDKAGTSTNNAAIWYATTLTTFESLGPFAITFHDVVGAESDNTYVGIHTLKQASKFPTTNGEGILCRLHADTKFTVIANGSSTNELTNTDFDFTSPHDIRIEYDGSEARLFIDGAFQSDLSFSQNNDFVPYLFKQDANGTAETLKVPQITVSPLTEVLR